MTTLPAMPADTIAAAIRVDTPSAACSIRGIIKPMVPARK